MRRLRGLTLIEVLVAMTILTVGILGVVGAVGACVRASDAAAAYSRAAVLAQQTITDIARNATLEPGTLDGTFDDAAATGYTWTADIGDADDQGVYPVKVTVAWERDTRHFQLQTLLRPHDLPLPPAPDDSAQGGGTETGAGAQGGTETGTGPGMGTGSGTGAGAGGGTGAGGRESSNTSTSGEEQR